MRMNTYKRLTVKNSINKDILDIDLFVDYQKECRIFKLTLIKPFTISGVDVPCVEKKEFLGVLHQCINVLEVSVILLVPLSCLNSSPQIKTYPVSAFLSLMQYEVIAVISVIGNQKPLSCLNLTLCECLSTILGKHPSI